MQNIVILLVTAFAAGILLAGAGICSFSLLVLYKIAIAMFFIVLVSIFCRSSATTWLLGALFFVCGFIHLMHMSEIPISDISRFAGQKITVVGKLVDVPQITPVDATQIRVRYKIGVNTVLTEQGERIPVTGAILVSLYQKEPMPIATYGVQTVAAGKLALPHSYGNPGLIDGSAALRREGITARMLISDGRIAFEANVERHWQDTLAGWRESVISRMGKAMPPDNAALLVGTLFGGYSGIPRNIVESFTTTGLVHILSVSGTHIALVAGVILWLASILRMRLGAAAFLAAMAIVLYALISGGTPPVIRSAVMGVIGLAAIGLGREKDAPTALMLTAFSMLIYQPEIVYDISFQLSFGATAGLIFLYAKTFKRLDFLPRWLASPFAVTLAAQLGVLPFIAWYFANFSLSAFIANILVVPIIEVAVVIGLFTAVLGAVFPPANLLWIACSSLIDVVVLVTQKLAAIPGASVYIPPIGFWWGLPYYCILAWMYGYKPQRVPYLSVMAKRWPKVSTAAVLICAVAVAIYINIPRPLYVHFIDVGQGDATLVVTPHRRAVLIDTGGTTGDLSNDFDIGDRVVLPYLKHYGILSIDYLILTHGHQDHAGGASAIASHLPVRNILLAREPFTKVIEKLTSTASGSHFIPAYKNQEIFLDGVLFTVVHDVTGIRPKSANESSSVIRVSYGQHSFLVTGDLDSNGEKEILDGKVLIGSTVLKVSHHGSKTSTSANFLARVNPNYAVISVGYNNRFGHPHSEVLNRLAEQGSQVFRTDEHGAVVFQSDGNMLCVDTFR